MDIIPVIMAGDEVASVLPNFIFDLRQNAHRDHSYFRAHPGASAYLRELESLNVQRVLSLEYLTANPKYHKREIGVSIAGASNYENARGTAQAYRNGVGPSVDGLFFQSNFGIVTEMDLWLMPKPEHYSAFIFSADSDGDLSTLIQRLAPLERQNLLPSAVHIGNDLRFLANRTRYPWDRTNGQTPLPVDIRRQLRREFGIGAWVGCGALYGTYDTVRAVEKRLKKELRGFHPVFLDDKKLKNAERFQKFLSWFGAGEPLKQKILSAKPISAEEVFRLMQQNYEKFGFDAPVTFTMITERALVAVSNVAYDRRDEVEAARAKDCYKELSSALMDRGYMPYRTGPTGFADLTRHSSHFWDFVTSLKQAIDPNSILSPGHYVPTQENPGEKKRVVGL